MLDNNHNQIVIAIGLWAQSPGDNGESDQPDHLTENIGKTAEGKVDEKFFNFSILQNQ